MAHPGVECMRRVLVIGSGGSGKTRLARELGARLHLPVIHLDALYWRSGWIPTPGPEWRQIVAALTAEPQWVMDGNYGGTLDLRLAAADTVVFMDTPRYICISRVVWRWLRYRGRTRPHMALGCPEKVTWDFLLWIWNYPKRRRPAILRRLAELPPGRIVYVLRSHADRGRLLAELPRPEAR